jgi:hypothetical protein
MCSKVSPDWVPSYIKAMQPVLEIFKMDENFPDSPHTSSKYPDNRLHTRKKKKGKEFNTERLKWTGFYSL